MSRVERFLGNISMIYSPRTVLTYRLALNEFFKSVYGQDGLELEEKGDKYFLEDRNYEEDIQNFFKSICGKAPKFARQMLRVVTLFLRENHVELREKPWLQTIIRQLKAARTASNRRRVQRWDPTTEQLRRAFSHAPIQGKALFLTMASSGIRISEVLKVNTGDIELDKEPARIRISGEFSMAHKPRVIFISREAKEAVQEWLKVRREYLAAASRKSRPREHYKEEFKGKNVEDDRLFPFENNTAYAIWKNMLRKSGLLNSETATSQKIFPLHSLRRFFCNKMMQASPMAPMAAVDALLGYESRLKDNLSRLTEEYLASMYLDCEPALLIFTQPTELEKLKAYVEEKDVKLAREIIKLTLENRKLECKIETLTNENKVLQDKINALSNKM